ncbi:methylenetetrahydrofolate dehydrogenase (NADP+)/methenyltetrahydrofolate cyclohydrolase [Metamycoplasma subdolum]|uniref:Bifunctional protein FolD n=1 Tax=Metamycoplasma subdolum TaxID=92407 RepID=A0A3M0A8B4_9BACT|nr:bifunctional 5,10-methylenetetrahydrofolate dehydrogenase/5,10-methenyltetrahydrofolate cyclohydrolase [Metamycoplasma subdolum]RMA78655.1 methylenetetrahydrofolate dehydrogenase (NADP+)/methenyltetrahydrofolate cyclohydrolase [Metamycoplasma subdolum]WPB50743.1 bifunctional 5,10-methylenetetrahydrofolate dehydrogenase/5,10-methenyltetrahydrofolate cyclohydrolase [Metamycoplasma subdolum]
MFELLDGKNYSEVLKEEIKNNTLKLGQDNLPILGILQVGDEAASNYYVSHKIKVAKELGINALSVKLKSSSKFNEIKEALVNLTKKCSGLIVQLPIATDIKLEKEKVQELLDLIPFEKDIDGLSMFNQNSSYDGKNNFMPATAKGIILLLNKYDINFKNTTIAVVGKSFIVGKPLASYFSTFKENKVFTYEKGTSKDTIKNAKIVIVATGERNSVTYDMLQNNVVLVDVGIHRINGKIYGDLDFDKCKEKASFITPVPGGVGPMTVISLILNLIKSYILQNPKKGEYYKEIIKYL